MKVVWIHISWLLMKPADLDLHYYQKRLGMCMVHLLGRIRYLYSYILKEKHPSYNRIKYGLTQFFVYIHMRKMKMIFKNNCKACYVGFT